MHFFGPKIFGYLGLQQLAVDSWRFDINISIHIKKRREIQDPKKAGKFKIGSWQLTDSWQLPFASLNSKKGGKIRNLQLAVGS